MICQQITEEKYEYLYKNLESKTVTELMNLLMIDSLNCTNKLDINAFAALHILGKKGNNAVPLLGEALFNDRYCDQVKIEILNTLCEIHSKGVIPYLQKASKDENRDISIEAVRVLSTFEGYTADPLIDELLKVKGDDKKTFKVLQTFALRSYSHLRGNIKAYDILVPIVLDDKMAIRLRRTALVSLAGINIQQDEILLFCKNIIPDDSINISMRTAAMYVVSRYKKVEFIDLIYDTIVNTSDIRIVRSGLFQLTEFQHPLADDKIKEFKELLKDEKYLEDKQESVSKCFSSYESKFAGSKISENDKLYSTDVRFAYSKYIRTAEFNIERMNKSGIRIP